MSKKELPGQLFSDFRVLLYLFISLRVILLIVYQPQLIETSDPEFPVVERGLTVLGDYREHYEFSSKIGSDNLPYRDYWVEFPPVWPALTAVTYTLFDNFTNWASVIFLIMTVFDTGNLVLMRTLGGKLHGTEQGVALSWVYALLAAPLVIVAWNFESIVIFTLLAGFWLYIQGKIRPSGTIIAFGILTKYLPLLILPMIWRFMPRREALVYSAVSVGLVLLVLIPLVLWGDEMAITSLTVQFDKPSYQTVWALLDGNYATGSFPGGEIRYDAGTVKQPGNAAVIPGWLRLIPFAGFGLWLFSRPMPTGELIQFAFLSMTIVIFTLWSQGWSPQWVILLLPLILLNFPSRLGVLAAVTFMVGTFIEYPLLFRYGAESGNIIGETYRLPFAMLILARTTFLTGFAWALMGKLK